MLSWDEHEKKQRMEEMTLTEVCDNSVNGWQYKRPTRYGNVCFWSRIAVSYKYRSKQDDLQSINNRNFVVA